MANSFEDQTPRQYMRSLKLVHFALLFGMIIFAGVVYYVNPSTRFDYTETGVFIFAVPIIMILGILLGNLIFNKLVIRTYKQKSLKTKLDNYLSALIIKFAFVEGPGLLSLVGYLLTGNLIYLFLAIILVIYFLTLTPSKSSLIDALRLTGELKTQFEDENKNVF